jgi:hypothetical protein
VLQSDSHYHTATGGMVWLSVRVQLQQQRVRLRLALRCQSVAYATISLRRVHF